MSPELIPPKKWRYRGMGRYIVRASRDGFTDVYAGARTLEGARARRREVSHWPDVAIYDQATDSEQRRSTSWEPVTP